MEAIISYILYGEPGWSDYCPSAFKVEMVDDFLRINKLSITIESQHAFLYESIMNLIQTLASEAIEALHSEISEMIADAITDSFERRKGVL